MNTTYTKRFGIAVLIVALAGTAFAAEPNDEDAGLLRGPEVVESSGADAVDSMSGSAEKSRKAGDLPFRAYIGAVRALNKAAQENPELALTDEQKAEIKEIAQEHKKKMKAFMEAHKDEIGEFRGKHGKKGERKGERGAKGVHGQRGGPPGELDDERPRHGQAGDRPSPEEMQRMREKRGQLMAKAPSDQDAKKQLWAVLTPEQQAAVKENIKDMRAKRKAKIGEGFSDNAQRDGKGETKRKDKRKGQKHLDRSKKVDSSDDD